MSVAGRLSRSLAIAAPLALLAVPAHAADESEMAPVIEALSDPDRQQTMAQTLSALSQMLLDLPVRVPRAWTEAGGPLAAHAAKES